MFKWADISYKQCYPRSCDLQIAPIKYKYACSNKKAANWLLF